MRTADYRNRILTRLTAGERERLEPDLKHISLDFKEPVYEQGTRITQVYFVNSGVISLVTELQDGQVIETATVGREGMVGLPAFFGASTAPWRALCQIPGDGFRLSAEVLRVEAENGGSLGHLLARYANAAMAVLAQSVACNRAHPLERECAAGC